MVRLWHPVAGGSARNTAADITASVDRENRVLGVGSAA
jgi:hypothetical protein